MSTTIIGPVITASATVLTAVITSVWVRHRERKPPEIGEQVRKVEEENDELDKVTSDEDPPDKIIEIVEYSLGKPRDVWGKLLMIRMALRRLLRSTADAHGIRFSRETTGIMTMNDRLKEKGIIDKDLHDVIETVHDATFTAEWGIGKEAHP